MSEGYKITEIGLIPESWDVIRLGNLLKLQGGYAFKSEDACENGVRWLKIANVGINNITWNESSFLPSRFESLYKDYLLKENDVVIAMTRPILGDNLKIAKIQKGDAGALLNQRVGRLIADSKINLNFAYQLINSATLTKMLKKEILGTDPPNISSNTFEKLIIALPSFDEQKKIAKILSMLDEKIDVITTQIIESEKLKRGLAWIYQ